jgi:ArsR family transcriptional regulator, arsenate/arsenite/antimonite-responsive transcriptional repressor
MNMQSHQVIEALSALAHEHRLRIYRLLVEQGPEGMSAGAIADKIGLAPSSLTFHVQGLQRARLITQRRASRQLIYAADFHVMNGVTAFLTENCCGRGHSGSSTKCIPAAAKSQRSRRA